MTSLPNIAPTFTLSSPTRPSSTAPVLGIPVPDGFTVTPHPKPEHKQGKYLRLLAQEYDTHDSVNSAQTQMREFVVLRKMAAAILPMCPKAQKYLMLRQFRYPPYHNALANQVQSGKTEVEDGWLYEIIAGVIDPGHTPETTVVKEAKEEGNIVINPGDIKKVHECYMTPGVTNEIMHIFLAIVPDIGSDGPGGLASEGEQIRAKWMTAGEIQELHRKGLIKDAKTLMALYAARVL